jgi:hypothetical protein
MTRSARGFSLVEAMVATMIVAAVTAIAFATVNPVRAAFDAQPEAEDMHQRLRVAAESLRYDIAMSGAGPYFGAHTGALTGYFAPVLPYRRLADAPGSFRTDALTTIYVPATAAQATLAAAMTSSSTVFTVTADSSCPVGKAACGFVAGDTALVVDASGHFDTFTVLGVSGSGGMLAPDFAGATGVVYGAGATIVKAVVRAYVLKPDPRVPQLLVFDGGAAAAPIADHVVGVTFQLYGDAQPPTLIETSRPTYGPAPPPIGTQTTEYPPGENCAFRVDAVTGTQVPRGAVFGGADALVPLTSSVLTDGPWCPDESSPSRYDLDLLRVRTIGVTLRVESALDALRGPAGVLFVRPGTGTITGRLLPDLEVTFQLTPRSLLAGQ